MPLLHIEELLAVTKQGDQAFRSLIEDLARTHGSHVYQALFKAMFQIEMTASEARHHWQTALWIQEKSRPRISLRAALLDQLHCHTDILADPRIIEAEVLKKLYSQAMTDGLTCLYNQSYFKLQLEFHVNTANGQPGTVFSLLLFDLDQFKQYNDRCGHLLGDKALAQISQALREALPHDAIAARYGGEEFAILLPNTPQEEAILCAENIRSLVENLTIEGEDRLDKGCLTISGGIATYPIAGNTSIALITHADSNLYEAKKTRNQIVPRTANTRQIIRHVIHNIVHVFDSEKGSFKSSLSSDISHTGMLLKSDLSAEVGADLILRFPFPYWPSEHSVEARVRHVRSHTSRGTFLIGVEFNNPQIAFIENILSAELYAAVH